MIPKIQHQTPKWVFGMGGGGKGDVTTLCRVVGIGRGVLCPN